MACRDKKGSSEEGRAVTAEKLYRLMDPYSTL